MPSLELKFQKQGDYGLSVFTCSNEHEPESYQKSVRYQKKLSDLFTESFCPIYVNDEHEYATWRFKTSKSFAEGSLYYLKFKAKSVERRGKKFCNLHIVSVKLINRRDDGVDIDLSDDDEPTEF